MAKDLNQCNFIGRLGKDIELKYMPDGKAVANFSIAVGNTWKDKNSGEKVEKTEWVNISVFGKLAEICGEYLHKGSKIFLSGSIRTRKWQDKDGNDRYTTEIVANEMQMLDSRSDSGGSSGGYSKPNNRPSSQGQANTPNGNDGFDDFDDDLPF